MRTRLAGMTCVVLMLGLGSRAFGQPGYGGYGYGYAARPAAPMMHWPAQPNPWAGLNMQAQNPYPPANAAWQPPQLPQPGGYMPGAPPAADPGGAGGSGMPVMPPADAPVAGGFAPGGPVGMPMMPATMCTPVMPPPPAEPCAPACPPRPCPPAVVPCQEVEPDPEPAHGLRLSFGYYYIAPYIETNPAFESTIGIGSDTPLTRTTNFDYNFNSAYQVLLGHSFIHGLGVRGRYFHMSTSANGIALTNEQAVDADGNVTVGRVNVPSTLPDPRNFSGVSLFGSPGLLLSEGVGADNLFFTSRMSIDTIDAEVTREMDFGCLCMVFTAGGRYAKITQTYRGTQSNTGTITPDPATGLLPGW